MAEYGGTWFFLETQTALTEEIRRAGGRVSGPSTPSSVVWLADGVLRTGDDAITGIADAHSRATAIEEAVRRLASEIDATPERWPDIEAVRDLDVPVTAWLEANAVPPDATAFMLAFAAMMGGGEPGTCRCSVSCSTLRRRGIASIRCSVTSARASSTAPRASSRRSPRRREPTSERRVPSSASDHPTTA